jgi:hypothetical protein
MRKEELIELIKNLPTEDTTGDIIGIFYNRHGEQYTTDSIRVDMDGGRIILAQKGSGYHETNKKNWEQEIRFIKNVKGTA